MYLLFDIGATKMRLAVSSNLKTFTKPVVLPTPKNFIQGISRIAEAATKLSAGKKILAAAGGIAGVLDHKNEQLLASPHLTGWTKKPLKDRLQKKLGGSVFLENDAAVVGLGEATAGAGRGYGIVGYFTISTGVGGARIVDGQVDITALGFEPGHQIIDFRTSGADLETAVSGTAVKKRYKKDPWEITDKKIWRQVSEQLAVGVHNAIVFWSPDVIVLGGGMMKNPGIDINHVRNHVKKTLKRFSPVPPIKPAVLKDIGGIYGALRFLRQHLNQ